MQQHISLSYTHEPYHSQANLNSTTHYSLILYPFVSTEEYNFFFLISKPLSTSIGSQKKEAFLDAFAVKSDLAAWWGCQEKLIRSHQINSFYVQNHDSALVVGLCQQAVVECVSGVLKTRFNEERVLIGMLMLPLSTRSHCIRDTS